MLVNPKVKRNGSWLWNNNGDYAVYDRNFENRELYVFDIE